MVAMASHGGDGSLCLVYWLTTSLSADDRFLGVYIQVPIRSLSLHGDAFDLHKKTRPSQFTDTDARPCTSAPRKDLVLHAPKERHVTVHFDMVRCHFDNIFKGAATGFQDQSEIVPGCQKLLLRVFDDG